MDNQKKLSSRDVRRIVGFAGKQHKKVTWHTSELNIKQFINATEYFDTIQKILRDVTREDGSIAIEFIDFAIRTNIILSYALVELPIDSEELFRIVYCSDLYDIVCSYANKAQISSIKNAVMMSIGVGGE